MTASEEKDNGLQPGDRIRGLVFTLNNYTEPDESALQRLDWVQYGIYGRETGDKGTPHLQGYLSLKKRTSYKGLLKKLKAVLSNHPWIQRAVTVSEAIDYCKKKGDYVEWGTMPKPGKRTDISDFYKAAATMDDADLAENYGLEFAKYHRAADKYRAGLKERDAAKELAAGMRSVRLRPWQRHVVESLKQQEDRKILWIFDYVGGFGKTLLAKWLIWKLGACYVQGGKRADIAYHYQGEEYVVCDYTREKSEYMEYGTLESLKNGLIFSPKYQAKLKKRAKGAKIVVFANWPPDLSKMSADRWDLRELKGETGAELLDSICTEKNPAPEGRYSEDFIFDDDAVMSQGDFPW